MIRVVRKNLQFSEVFRHLFYHYRNLQSTSLRGAPVCNDLVRTVLPLRRQILKAVQTEFSPCIHMEYVEMYDCYWPFEFQHKGIDVENSTNVRLPRMIKQTNDKNRHRFIKKWLTLSFLELPNDKNPGEVHSISGSHKKHHHCEHPDLST